MNAPPGTFRHHAQAIRDDMGEKTTTLVVLNDGIYEMRLRRLDTDTVREAADNLIKGKE